MILHLMQYGIEFVYITLLYCGVKLTFALSWLINNKLLPLWTAMRSYSSDNSSDYHWVHVVGGGGWGGFFSSNLIGFATIPFLFQSLEILHKKRLVGIIQMIHIITMTMVNILTTMMKVYIAQWNKSPYVCTSSPISAMLVLITVYYRLPPIIRLV